MRKVLLILFSIAVLAVLFYLAIIVLYDRPHLIVGREKMVVIEGCDRFDIEYKKCTSLLCEKEIYNSNLVPKAARPVRYSSRYDISNVSGMIVHFIEYINREHKGEKYFTICVLESGKVKKIALIEEEDFGSASLYIK